MPQFQRSVCVHIIRPFKQNRLDALPSLKTQMIKGIIYGFPKYDTYIHMYEGEQLIIRRTRVFKRKRKGIVFRSDE